MLAELRDALARLEGKTDEYQLQMIDACKNGIKPEGSLSGQEAKARGFPRRADPAGLWKLSSRLMCTYGPKS